MPNHRLMVIRPPGDCRMEIMRKKPARRLADARKVKEDMAVILQNAPPRYDWGWFSREDQRMHLQVFDRKHIDLHYKVWLENKGRRGFEPEPGIPSKVLKRLEAKVHERRGYVE